MHKHFKSLLFRAGPRPGRSGGPCRNADAGAGFGRSGGALPPTRGSIRRLPSRSGRPTTLDCERGGSGRSPGPSRAIRSSTRVSSIATAPTTANPAPCGSSRRRSRTSEGPWSSVAAPFRPTRPCFIALTIADCSSLEEPPFSATTATEQRACANSFADLIVVESSLFCTIDGQAVANLVSFRFESPQFPFNAPTPWIFNDGVAPAGTGTAVSDGYFLMIKPLSSGVRTRCAAGAIVKSCGLSEIRRRPSSASSAAHSALHPRTARRPARAARARRRRGGASALRPSAAA